MTTATTATATKHIGEVLFQEGTKKVLREESQNTPTTNPERWSIWKQMRNTDSPVEKEEPELTIDLIIEEIAQDVILIDEDGSNSKWLTQLTNWISYQINR